MPIDDDLNYNWIEFLREHNLGENYLVDKCPPIRAFRHAPLASMVEVFDQCSLMVQYSKETDQKPDGYTWVAVSTKIAGYYVYLKHLGSEKNKKIQGFWVHMLDKTISPLDNFKGDIQHLDPPPHILKLVDNDITKLVPFGGKRDSPLSRALPGKYFDEQKKRARQKLCEYNLRKGMIGELVDFSFPSQVRPARIIDVLGRRLCFQVDPEYFVPNKKEGEKKKEEKEEKEKPFVVWLDQTNGMFMHVGWAMLNGYKLQSTKPYIEHSRKVAEAIKKDLPPPYKDNDIRKETIEEVRKDWGHWVPEGEFEENMKLELLDPTGSSLMELHVATVVKLLRDGYLTVRFDGPDSDVIPLHITSSCMFPVGYAEQFEIPLNGPDDHFTWDKHLAENGGVPAPVTLFKSLPTAERLSDFPIQAKIEAYDTVEKVGICPASVKGHRGRLLKIGFDGWDSSFDQLVDIDSTDIFPMGWCKMHGINLDDPKFKEFSLMKGQVNTNTVNQENDDNHDDDDKNDDDDSDLNDQDDDDDDDDNDSDSDDDPDVPGPSVKRRKYIR